MRRPRHYGCIVSLGTIALAVACAAARAQTLPRLPGDFTFPQGDGSPGEVPFTHGTHVSAARPDCTTCHPALFKILASGSPADGMAINHAVMEREQQCGACHNGKVAFGPDNPDNCGTCHRGSGP